MAEIVACPSCHRQLQIPEGFFGQLVQCPDCRHQFTATPAADSIQESKTPPMPGVPSPATEERPRRPRNEDTDDDDDYGRRRRSRYDNDDDDDYDDYKPRFRRRHEEPHRASMIMTLGILSIFVAPLVLGTLAWVMGNADIRAMEEGRMDPSGMSQTQTGRTIGAVMVVLHGILLVLLFLFIFGMMAAGH